jgi:hypothetical protein
MNKYKSYIKRSLSKSFPWKLFLIVVGLIYLKRILSFFKSSETSEDIKTREDSISSLQLDYTFGLNEQKSKQLAYNLLDAFNYNTGGMILGGTDKSSITAVFNQLDHPEDYKKIYKEFGLQRYNGQGLADETNILGKIYDRLDLTGWIRAELDFFDFTLNSLVKEKITNSGLTY